MVTDTGHGRRTRTTWTMVNYYNNMISRSQGKLKPRNDYGQLFSPSGSRWSFSCSCTTRVWCQYEKGDTELFELDTIRQEQSHEPKIDQVIKAIQKNSTMNNEWHNSDLGRAYSKGRLQLTANGILKFVNYRGKAT